MSYDIFKELKNTKTVTEDIAYKLGCLCQNYYEKNAFKETITNKIGSYLMGLSNNNSFYTEFSYKNKPLYLYILNEHDFQKEIKPKEANYIFKILENIKEYVLSDDIYKADENHTKEYYKNIGNAIADFYLKYNSFFDIPTIIIISAYLIHTTTIKDESNADDIINFFKDAHSGDKKVSNGYVILSSTIKTKTELQDENDQLTFHCDINNPLELERMNHIIDNKKFKISSFVKNYKNNILNSITIKYFNC